MNVMYVCMLKICMVLVYVLCICIHLYMYIRTKGSGGRKLMARVKTFHLININLVQDACVCVVQAAVNGNQREVKKGIGYDV